MDLIDQVTTTERFEERLSVRVPMTCVDVAPYFLEAGRIVQWYAGGQSAWIDDVDSRKTTFTIGDDYETEWECLEVHPDRLILRQRIENSPPVTATISLAESDGITNVDVMLSGEMSVFWKQKFLSGWSGIICLPDLATFPH